MTQHILLTTIGTGNYEEVSYAFGEKVAEKTRFFSSALLRHLSGSNRVTDVIVLLTGDAAAHVNWQGEKGLKQALRAADADVTIVETGEPPIPDGLTEDDIWTIFNRIESLIPDNCTITLDVTHGFRSLPLIMLLSVAYLRLTKNLTLNAMYYGAYAAKKPGTTEGEEQPAPVLDLTPFLTMFEWANAADAFGRTGDLRQFAELLKSRQISLHKSGRAGKEDLPKYFTSIAGSMDVLSAALDLGRLEELAGPLKNLRKNLPQQEEKAARWLPPLRSQIERITEAIVPLTPTGESIEDKLAAQFRLIEWYVERGHLMHAGLLLREWLVTWYGAQLDTEKDWSALTKDKNQRHEIEKKLGELAQLERPLSLSVSRLHITLTVNDTSLPIAQIWNSLAELRNDLGHLGHRENASSASAIGNQLGKLIDQLRPLVQHDPEPSTPSETS